MTERNTFSRRHNLIEDAPITVRHDAPEDFRYMVVESARAEGDMSPSNLRSIVCRVLHCQPDSSNWSEYPNVWGEVTDLVRSCRWNKVYDIAEAIYSRITLPEEKVKYQGTLNETMREIGIGWMMEGGQFKSRGSDSFENQLSAAQESLERTGLQASDHELREAIRDLSRRPQPDTSGAIQHATAALESLTRHYFNEPGATLGQIISRNRDQWPKPLDQALEKIWGYASENARHGNEDRVLGIEEAQLTVGIAAVMINYFVQKLPASDAPGDMDDIPF